MSGIKHVASGKPNDAWALLAVSSEQQTDTLPHQKAWAQKTAKAKGWRLTRVFEKSGSGKAGPREIVYELVAALRAMKPESRPGWLLTIRLDRIGRGDIFTPHMVLRDLANMGVSVWTRDVGQLKIDTAMEQLVVAAQAAAAQHENANRSDKARDTFARKRATGLAPSNQRPYGLRIDPQTKRDVADEPLADVVREAFKLRMGGAGYHLIGLKLASVAPARRYSNGSVRVVKWTATRVLRLLQNRAYVGPVIDEGTFARAQQVRERLGPVRKQNVFPWPLSGSIRCYCGRAMAGLCSGPPAHRTRYYRCSATWNHAGKMRLCRADDLEAEFVDLLKRIRAKPELVAAYRKKSAGASGKTLERSLRAAKDEVADLDRRRDKAWALNAAGKVRDDDLQERLDKLGERRRELESNISALEERLSLAAAAIREDRDADAVLSKAAKLFSRASDEDRRRIARAVSVSLGGLCVAEPGDLVVRRVEETERQRRKKTGEA